MPWCLYDQATSERRAFLSITLFWKVGASSDSSLLGAAAASAALLAFDFDLEVFRAGLEELVMTGDRLGGERTEREKRSGERHLVTTASMIVRFMTTRPVVVSR